MPCILCPPLPVADPVTPWLFPSWPPAMPGKKHARFSAEARAQQALELARGVLAVIYIRCAKQLEAARRSCWAAGACNYLPDASKAAILGFLVPAPS